MSKENQNVAILALGTSVPSNVYKQEDVANQSIAIFKMDQEKTELAKRIYKNSAILKRHSVVEDFKKPREEWSFLSPQYPNEIPGMSARNKRYKMEAPNLAKQSALQAIERWGGDCSQITHLISISCTGVLAPGIEFHLMQDLGLSPTINRLGINFMGCFGAFKGLSVARAFALENPDNRILLVCTELCSLHMQADLDNDTITANSLFGDGSASALIGGNCKKNEVALWNIVRTHSLGFKNSINKMTWEASDRGFLMRLCYTVPALIGRQIKDFTYHLLNQEIDIENCDWVIHPGGKSIIQAVERSLKLKPEQTKSSWEIFANYGNMSSATFLFVLEHLCHQINRRQWAAGVGFGPGLSAEGVLLKSL